MLHVNRKQGEKDGQENKKDFFEIKIKKHRVHAIKKSGTLRRFILVSSRCALMGNFHWQFQEYLDNLGILRKQLRKEGSIMSHKSSQSETDKLNSVSDNMVERLRRKISAKSIIGTILLIMIASVFVFFGLPTQKYGGNMGSVAEINGKFITLSDFQQEENRIMEQYSQYFKGQDMGPMRKMLKGQALSNLVNNELVAQGASSEKLLVSPVEIRDVLVTEIPIFQENGRFKRDRYQQYLDGTRSTAGEFENKIEKSLQQMRLRRIFESALLPSQVEVEKEQLLSSSSFKLAFVKIEKKASEPKVSKATEPATDSVAPEEDTATKKYQEEIKNVNALLAEKNSQKVDSYLKETQLKFKEAEGNLQQMFFGELPAKVAEEALMELKKAGEVTSKLISDGSDQYIVKLISFNLSKAPVGDLEKEKDSLNRRMASTVFENWVTEFKKKSLIEENKQILEMN